MQWHVLKATWLPLRQLHYTVVYKDGDGKEPKFAQKGPLMPGFLPSTSGKGQLTCSARFLINSDHVLMKCPVACHMVPLANGNEALS